MPKVMIVDDSMAMRRIIGRILHKIGAFECVESYDGKDALCKLKEHPDIALVLVDYNMAVMDGLEFVKAVRADGILIPIVMVTNEGSRKKVTQCLRAGANDFLAKPFQIENLIEKIRTLLGENLGDPVQ